MLGKKKICKRCGNLRHLWSKGLCLYCSNLTKEKKKPKRRKVNYDPKIKQKDHEFYNGIWEKRPHVCGNCNAFLGNEPLTIYFDHILEKSKYPEYRYNENNIWLLCWNCHTNKTNGIYSDKMREVIVSTGKLLDDKQKDEDTTTSS